MSHTTSMHDAALSTFLYDSQAEMLVVIQGIHPSSYDKQACSAQLCVHKQTLEMHTVRVSVTLLTCSSHLIFM